MDGICKIAISQTRLNNKKLLYDALCFIEYIESSSDCYKISWHFFKQLKVEEKPKALKKIEEILKLHSCLKNKVIFVFNNVNNQSQIEVILTMDDLFAISGSKLIVTIKY